MSRSSGARSFAGLPWSVIAIAGIVVVVLLLLSPLYGWHRDELYFVAAGRHPALGYVDQPSITPLLSAAAVALLGAVPTAVRILPALVMGAVIVLAGLTARDLGGSHRAQLIAAVTVAISGFLAIGHIGVTATYDLLAWAVVLWLVVRLLAGADRRSWLLVGLTAGIALENKHTILFLGAGLAAGLLLARRWDVIRSPWAWSALGLAVLLWLPNLAWQAANGWPQLKMAASIARDAGDQRAMFFVELALLAGPLLFPVAIAGGSWLLASPAARAWRALGWTSLVVLALVLLVGGKSYYAAGVVPLLLAAGSIALDGWLARGRTSLRAGVVVVAAAFSSLIAIVLVLPIVPATSLGSTPIPDVYKESAEQIGWPELVTAVEEAVAGLPPEDRARAVIVAENYAEAGALEVLAGDLPPVYSGHNAYWYWGPPPDDRTVVVTVGWRDLASQPLPDCTFAGLIANEAGVTNQELGRVIAVCPGPRDGWQDAWESFRRLG